MSFSFVLTLVNSLDPDQDRQNVGPDLDPNCLTLKKIVLKKSADDNKKNKA